MFKIEIETDNAAFNVPWAEIHRILLDIVGQMCDRPPLDGQKLRDFNGNTVGRISHDLD